MLRCGEEPTRRGDWEGPQGQRCGAAGSGQGRNRAAGSGREGWWKPSQGEHGSGSSGEDVRSHCLPLAPMSLFFTMGSLGSSASGRDTVPIPE